MTLNERILQLEQQIKDLTDIINNLDLTKKVPKPYTVGGNSPAAALSRAIDIRTGLGTVFGGPVVWNSLEANTPRADNEISVPLNLDTVQGYNRHSHSRISGGALEANTLEVVEFDFVSQNPHNAQYWQSEPKRKKVQNSNNESIEKIGKLALIFNPDTLKWGTEAYEINVKDCYFVQRNEEGEIEVDENGNQMKSPLWNEDITKTSLLWDKTAQVWRVLAVYAGEQE